MDARCTGNTCKELKTQTADVAMKCTKQPIVQDPIEGCKLHVTDLQIRHELNLTDYFFRASFSSG
jgi:hypothetical protein